MKITAKIKINPADVIWIESDVNYSKINFMDGSQLLVSYTLKKVADSLKNDQSFIRIHKSYLVNKHCISAIRKDKRETYVLLDDRCELLVSRRNKYLVKELISQLIFQ
jgi:two-component system, LytTR family, response regulator